MIVHITEDIVNFKDFKKDRWSPYLVGVLLGLLLFLLLNFGQHLGACTGVNRVAFLLSYFINSAATMHSAYFGRMLSDPTIFNVKVLFILSIIGGSWLASYFSDSAVKDTTTIWTQRFGRCPFKRHTAIFIGAVILILGNRIAGGCIAGHVLSGIAQHAVASVGFLATLLLSGSIVAKFLYRYGR